MNGIVLTTVSGTTSWPSLVPGTSWPGSVIHGCGICRNGSEMSLVPPCAGRQMSFRKSQRQVECRFHSVQGRHTTRYIHGVGRTGPRVGFLKSIQQVYEPSALPLHDALSSPEEGFRAFISFLRDRTIHARMNKSGKVLNTAPWKIVTVKDIDLEAEVELIDKKENTDMLPRLAA